MDANLFTTILKALWAILKAITGPLRKLRDAATKEPEIRESQKADERIEETEEVLLTRVDKNTPTFRNWDGHFQNDFFPDDKRSTIIAEIKSKIAPSNTESCQFFHITGVPGVGKSRLVYEAVRKSRGRIFTSPQLFWNSEFKDVANNERFRNETLVVDECNRDEAHKLKEFFLGNRNALHIITISPDCRTYEEEFFEVGKLSGDKIKTMLSSLLPGIDPVFLGKVAEFSDGNPRAAELFAKSIKSNPKRTALPNLTYNEFIKRLIAGERNPDSAEAAFAGRVLTCFSITTRTPYHPDNVFEIEPIARMLDLWGDNKLKEDARAEIRLQRERKVLQGEKYLYVSPLPLKLFLFREWIKQINPDQLDEMINTLSDDLKMKFFENFGALSDQSGGGNLAREILRATGPFSSGDLLANEDGSQLFLRLTGLVPETALETLEHTVGTWNDKNLSAWHDGRQQIVWALEKIVVHNHLFERGMKLLLKMSVNENASNTNNATGTWMSMFQVRLAGTQADFAARERILQYTLGLQDERSQRVGIKGIEHGFSLHPVSRLMGAEFQADQVLKLYSPSPQEVYEYRIWLWKTLVTCLLNNSFLASKEAKDVLADNFRGFSRIIPHNSLLMDLQKLQVSGVLLPADIIAMTKRVLARDRDICPPDFIAGLEAMLEGFFSADFGGRLKTLVQYSLFKDEFEDRDELVEEVKQLASEAFSDIDEKVLPYLHELLSYETDLAFWYGKFIGESDSKASLLKSALSHYRELSTDSIPRFILGYFVAIKERSEKEYTQHIRNLMEDEQLTIIVPALSSAVGLNDDILDLLMEALQSGKYTDLSLFNSFRYGGQLLSISESKFLEWFNLFSKIGTPEAIDIIFPQFYLYFVSGQPDYPLPYDVSINLLTSVLPLMKDGYSFEWKSLAKKILAQFPEAKLKILELICTALENIGYNYTMQEYGLKPVVADIIASEPIAAWKVVQKYLTMEFSHTFYIITSWLQGSYSFGVKDEDDGLIVHIPWTELQMWIDEDIENRAWRVAFQFVPHVVTLYGTMPKSHARSVLECYGERDDVIENMSANFSSGGWMGSEVRYWENKTIMLRELLEAEMHPNVIRFLKYQIAVQEKSKEAALLREEKYGY